MENRPLVEVQGTWTNPPNLEVASDKSNLLFNLLIIGIFYHDPT